MFRTVLNSLNGMGFSFNIVQVFLRTVLTAIRREARNHGRRLKNRVWG
jgi:hypothetical protein